MIKYKSLNYSGFIFESILMGFQDMFTQLYNDFKSEFTEKEILNKTKYCLYLLKSNIDFLKIGFKDYTTVFKYYSFQGFLAIK